MNRGTHIFAAMMPVWLVLLMAQQAVMAAALTEEQKGQAIAALEAVVVSPSPETTAALYEKVYRANVSAEDWAPVFREYLDKNHFSFTVGGALRDMIGTEGPGQEPAARAAGAFAAAALHSVLHTAPPNLQEFDAVLQWLEQCAGFAPPLVATIGMGLDTVLRNDTLDSALLGDRPATPPATPPPPESGITGSASVPAGPMPDVGTSVPGTTPSPSAPAALPPTVSAAVPDKAPTSPGGLSAPSAGALPPAVSPGTIPAALPPAFAPTLPSLPGADKNSAKDTKKAQNTSITTASFPPPAMQMAITLGYYAGPENIGRWMRLPDVSLHIYQASGVWVFDGGTLAPPLVTSLGSLLTAMPTVLTGVSVVTLVPLPFALRAPGIVLPLSPMSPELQRPPVMLPPGAMLPSIPEFTAMAARTLGDIIQQRELARRPELAKRRDILLLTAEGRANSVLYTFLAPGGYAGPDDFFPALLVLWATGSEAALRAASDIIDQGEYEGIYALLLLADLLSGGGDSTLVFSTSPAGAVSGGETALRRNFVAPGHAYVTGVAAGGRMFFFDGIEYETLAQL